MMQHSGWTGTSNGTCSGATDTIATDSFTVSASTFYYYPPPPEPPKYIPTKLDIQLQKKSFRAIQKQHERRCR
jgi:hypothetical protein